MKYEVPGIWDDEPDYYEWEHVGYKCVIRRNMALGFLCGYVNVPEGHSLYGCEMEYFYDLDIDVHGGVTWAGHPPFDQDDKSSWWIGFDCGHLYDYAPGNPILLGYADREYRTFDYVKEQTERLAEQINEIAQKLSNHSEEED